MTFYEYLAIKDKQYLVTVNLPAFFASIFLFHVFSAHGASVIFGFVTIACVFGFVHVWNEHKQYRSVAQPTFYIYGELMKHKHDIQVTNLKATYDAPQGAVIYLREFPGKILNDEMEHFSATEREILEYPFRQAVIEHESKFCQTTDMSEKDRAQRTELCNYFKRRESNEKNKF